jgi:hypothetical protein
MGQQIGFAREVSALKTRILASITLWFAAVASIAGIAWLAIDTAGRQVTAVPISAPMATDLTDPPTPSVAQTTSSSATSASPRSSVTGSSPRSRPTRTTSQPAKTSGSASVPTWVTGTYATTAGRLRVSCRAAQITLDGGYAQPAPGWSVRVQSGGPQRVQVLFELRDKQAVLVVAVCADGRPQFDQDRIEAGSPDAHGAGSGSDGTSGLVSATEKTGPSTRSSDDFRASHRHGRPDWSDHSEHRTDQWQHDCDGSKPPGRA